MATATEIAQRALKRLSVVQSGSTASASDVADAVEALNAMIASWEAEGFQGDVLPIDARFEQGLIAMLAVRLAEDYNVPVGPVLMRDAKRGEDQLDAAFLSVPPSSFDASLVNVYNNSSWIGIQDPHRWYKSWVANEDVDIYETRVLSGNLYEVSTAGTTGSTGPTGTGSGITDGSVTWVWRRVAG